MADEDAHRGRRSENGYDEHAPLLGDNVRYDDLSSTEHSPLRQPTAADHGQRVLLAPLWHVFVVIVFSLLLEFGSNLESLPLMQVYEKVICDSMHATSRPVTPVDCAHDPDVQSELAFILAARGTISLVCSTYMAISSCLSISLGLLLRLLVPNDNLECRSRYSIALRNGSGSVWSPCHDLSRFIRNGTFRRGQRCSLYEYHFLFATLSVSLNDRIQVGGQSSCPYASSSSPLYSTS